MAQGGSFSGDVRSEQAQNSGILDNATLFEAMLNKRKGLIIASESEIAEFRRKIGKKTEERMLADIRLRIQDEEAAEKALAEELVKIMQKAQATKFKNATNYEKIQMLETSKRHRQLAREDIQDMLAYYKAKGKLTDEEAAQRTRLRRQLRQIDKDEVKAAEELHTLKMQQLEQESDAHKKLLEATRKEVQETSNVLDKRLFPAINKTAIPLLQSLGINVQSIPNVGQKLAQQANQARQKANDLRADADLADKKLSDAKERYNEAAQKGDTDTANALLEEIRHLSQESEKANELAKEAEDNADVREKNQQAWANYDKELLKKGIETMTKTLTAALSAVDNDIDYIVSLRSPLMARLQGAEHSFGDMLNLVTKNLAVSPFVTQKAVLDKIKEAAEDGIAYNVEQRAFIASVSDKLVGTFDAFSDNIERMIRLQQADSTVARLGMEATLTKWLNGYFSDSSYLKTLFDSVSTTILEATSLLSRDEALAMEYQTQKWLSALYSLGLSDQTVNMIAQGISYLGTGNVQALAGNTQMQTLFAMAAARSGLSYANILLGGLNAEDTNKLLQAMVEYLRDIAANSANQVVKSSYGSILNLSLADLKAISNLTDTDIANISSLSQSYSDAVAETGRQMWDLPNRMSVGEMISTALANLSFTTAEGITNNPVTLALWQIVEMIQDATGGIPLPAVSVMGNMVDLSAFQVEQILQLALVGIGFLSNVGSVANSLGASFGMLGNLQAYWSGKEYLGRGQGNFITPTGASTGTSASGTVATSSSSDVANSAISEQTEDSEETAEITNKNVKPEHTFDEFYEAIFNEPLPITVRAGKEPVDGYFDWAYIAKSFDAYTARMFDEFLPPFVTTLFATDEVGFKGTIDNLSTGFTNTGTALTTGFSAVDGSVTGFYELNKTVFGEKSLIDSSDRLKVKDDGIDFSLFSAGGVGIAVLVGNIGNYIGTDTDSGKTVQGLLGSVKTNTDNIGKYIGTDTTNTVQSRLKDISSHIGDFNSEGNSAIGRLKAIVTNTNGISNLSSAISSASSSADVGAIKTAIGTGSSSYNVLGLLNAIKQKNITATVNAANITLSGNVTLSGMTTDMVTQLLKVFKDSGQVDDDLAEKIRAKFFGGGIDKAGGGQPDSADNLRAIAYQLLYGVTKVQQTTGARTNPFLNLDGNDNTGGVTY